METAIVVPVPEAAPAIDRIRRLHTPAGAEGMPAHVTLLVPFVDTDALSPEVVERAASAVRRFRSFAITLADLRYFDEPEAVLYLAPEPAEPFLGMIAALTAAFPGYPPYGGAHSEPIPHLTVAVGDPSRLRTFESEIAGRLPISASIDCALIFERDSDGRWTARERLPLDGSGSGLAFERN